MSIRFEVKVEDLYSVPGNGKAEIVNGEIIEMPPTGGVSGRSGGKIYRGLDDYEQATKSGYAFPDNVGFIVNLPHRKSFSPDAAFFTGELRGGDFPEGAPVFAVEVRRKNDYGATAEREIKQKRADYFACGTLVFWDVDVLRERVVRVYRADAPDAPHIYRKGDIAEAEPALPGWSLAVDVFIP